MGKELSVTAISLMEKNNVNKTNKTTLKSDFSDKAFEMEY